MADLAFLALTAVFFAICVHYIRAADRLIERAKTSGGGAKSDVG